MSFTTEAVAVAVALHAKTATESTSRPGAGKGMDDALEDAKGRKVWMGAVSVSVDGLTTIEGSDTNGADGTFSWKFTRSP